MAGETISGIGAFNQGKADQMAGQYNARVAEQNAVYAIEKSKEDERRQRVVSKKFLGDIRASYGASGITVDGGSALDVLQESAANAELDALTILQEGRNKAAAFRNQGAYDEAAGNNARKAGNLRAAGYLASGAQNMAMKFGGG